MRTSTQNAKWESAVLENEQECIQSLDWIFLVVGEQYSNLQSDQGVGQVEAGVEAECAGPFLGMGIIRASCCDTQVERQLVQTAACFFGGGDTFFICLEKVEGALSKLIKSDFFWKGGFGRL